MPENSDSHVLYHHPTHHPQDDDGDALDYKDYADAVCDNLCNARGENTGLTIGIFGDWGMGKSSVLRMLEKRLTNLGDRFCLVKFNAWHYARQEDLWTALLRCILLTVETDRIMPLWRVNYDLWHKRLDTNPLFWKSSRQIFIIGIILGLIIAGAIYALARIDSSAGRIALALSGGLVTFVGYVLKFTWTSVVAVLQNKLDLHIPSLAAPGFDQGEPQRVADFHRDFETLVKTVGARKTVVVMIDDLDRCPPDEVVHVLEAVKHFGFDRSLYTDHPCIVFVIAADRKAIHRAVSGYFKNYFPEAEPEKVRQFSHEYIEKIVQDPFVLPPLTRIKLGGLLDKVAGFGSN
jgi:hypothetical protein